MSGFHRNWAILLLFVSVALSSRVSFAAEPVEMLLWPDGAPGALGEEAKDKPKLIAYLPEANKATGAAVVICPGGGYGALAMDHEGHQIGQWLNSFGVAGFIVDYRHRSKGYGHPAPLQDAQRAIRTVRARAKEWNVKPDRIGILGFSAGGHLASTAATHFDDGNAEAKDAIEKVGSRPDFAVLCYAVIAFGEPYTHGGSQKNLLGDNAAPDLVKLLSNEKQVTEKTPPTFLWHTSEDIGVLPDNSTQFYLACIRHKVPAELHIYEKGRHGVGLGKGIAGTEDWPKACQTWMKGRGLIP
jgi:acetyl esterase/lipase